MTGAAPGLAQLLALLAVGLVLWTLTEYVLHRFVFHWQPASALMEQFVFIMHGNHHAVPNDPLRNLMPPMVSLPVGGLVWAGLVALAGPAGNWLFLGWMSGYVAYDLVHYACHQWPMKGRLARMLKTHHMHHHHLREEGNFAITGMMWDRLFRTRVVRRADGPAGAVPRTRLARAFRPGRWVSGNALALRGWHRLHAGDAAVDEIAVILRQLQRRFTHLEIPRANFGQRRHFGG